MEQFKKTHFPWFDYLVLTFAVLFSVILLFKANREEETLGLQAAALDVLGFATAPVQNFQRLLQVRAENQRLREQNARLRLELDRYREAFHENRRLEKLLDLRSIEPYRSVAARVIGFGNTPGVRTILVDAGADRSIRPNQPVVNGEGVVGRVIDVAAHHATVQLLVDRNFRAAARLQTSRVAGIYQWTGNRGLLNGIGRRVDVQLGESVITSGMESIYPPGLLIGTVQKIYKEKPGLFQEIEVRPSVNFNRLEEVFILLKTQTFGTEP